MTNNKPLPSSVQKIDIHRFQFVRRHSEAICSPLQTEDYVPQPVPFVSPPKWHLAHTTWFFETFLLIPFLKDYQLFHNDFSYLFNSYYNNVGNRVLRANRGNITRPGIEQVYAYRKHVDVHIGKLLEVNSSEEVLSLLELGLHHEQQHQELMLTDIKYILGHNPTFPIYSETGIDDKPLVLAQKWISVPENVYEIGHQGVGFCFDNELGKHKVYLHDFEISNTLITNQEYLEFMHDGGYQNFNLWLDEGWSWVNQNNIDAPLYWHKINEEWYHYTLKGLKPIQSNETLKHINFFEATAFAQWKGMRLPTEFEWEVASKQLKWGTRWEWTNSAYLPYPGFTKAPGAVGEYNGKFMVNQMVLRGASVATSPGHSRATYRNFFHADERWQFTGIRLVK